jgi:hypothetical protein
VPATTRILLATGEQIGVEAPVDEVVKVIENAARSSAGTLARLTLAGRAEPVAINPAHVVMVREGDDGLP